MPQKKKYDKNTKYAIAFLDKKDIYTTEFLIAKQFGYLPKFQGHSELKEYLRLIPFIFYFNLFDEEFQNLDNHKHIFSIFYNKVDRIFHTIDENNFLVSCYVITDSRYSRQIGKKFECKRSLNGRAALSSILSPAGPFWRHLDLIEQLYQELLKKSISKKDDYVSK